MVPQIGLLVLCLGVAGGALQFLSIRWEFWLLWKKVVIQTGVFHLRMRKGLGAILAGEVPARHKQKYATVIWTKQSVVCCMRPSGYGFSALLHTAYLRTAVTNKKAARLSSDGGASSVSGGTGRT